MYAQLRIQKKNTALLRILLFTQKYCMLEFKFRKVNCIWEFFLSKQLANLWLTENDHALFYSKRVEEVLILYRFSLY